MFYLTINPFSLSLLLVSKYCYCHCNKLGHTASIPQIQLHYDDVIMTMLASQITNLTVVYSIVYSGVNQRKHQSSASLAIVREIHRGPVNFPHKWPVTRKMFPFDDVIMLKMTKPAIHIYFFRFLESFSAFESDYTARSDFIGEKYSAKMKFEPDFWHISFWQ